MCSRTSPLLSSPLNDCESGVAGTQKRNLSCTSADARTTMQHYGGATCCSRPLPVAFP